MNELIKITEKDGQQLVSARELHEFLEVGRDFTSWIKGRISKYNFVENVDFTIINLAHQNGGASWGGNNKTDYIITVDMAKQLSMVENNEKGNQARKYFIQCEKKLKEINQPKLPTTYKEALLQLVAAEEEKERLQLESKQKDQIIGELKPKADYTDIILQNKSLVTITQIAKDYGMTAQEMNNLLHELKVQYKMSGQWLLYSKYHDKGYAHSETIPIKHKSGRLEPKMNTKWTQKGRLFLYELLKENGVLPVIEREDM